MPIVSELQRDRVALLLTLNVLVFVGYSVTVVMLVAAPSVWLVSFLIVGLAYNVVELWQSSPYRQPPDAVGLRARSATKPPATFATPKLGRAHRTDQVLGTQGFAIGRESLAQRLAELQASMPLQTASNPEQTTESVEATMPVTTSEAEAAALAELPAELLTDTGFQTAGMMPAASANLIEPTEAESASIGMTGITAANDPQVADIPDAELPVLQTMDAPVLQTAEQLSQIMPEILAETGEAAMMVDVGISVVAGVESVSADFETQTLNIVDISEPVFEPVAEKALVTTPLLAQVEDSQATMLPAVATVADDRVEDATQLNVEVEAEPTIAVTSAAVPSVTYVAGRRRDVVDIVIATMVADAKRAQPATKPVAEEPPVLAAKARTPSESLAMLRNELARTRGAAGAAAQAKAPAPPRKPLGAARKPGKSPADGTRDRVMFVWHGRHFLAPIEGRHPLRVAQSLYDFMVEEAMEHG